MNIIDTFSHRDASVALIHVKSARESDSWTHEQLRADTDRLAVVLRRAGVGTGERVLVISHSCRESMTIVLATFQVGATAVPVSPLLGDEYLTRIVRTLKPRCCLFDDPPTTCLEDALQDYVQLFISTRPVSPERAEDWKFYPTLLASETEGDPTVTSAADDTALIVHSSGSEGHPKAITFSHRQLITFFGYHHFLFSQFLVGEADRAPTVSVLPTSHLGGMAVCLYGLMRGAPVHVMNHFVPSLFLRCLEETRCPLIMMVPSMYRALLSDPSLDQRDLSSLHFCLTMGEPCTPDLAMQIARRFDVTPVSAYGMTECFTGLGHLREELARGRTKPGSCGKHCFGEVRLMDGDGIERPDFGELWVRNPSVHRCYMDGALNADRLRDGWFRTKDLFYRDPDGYFFHRGRCDEMFICNGKNIYPVEIERILHRHPAVEVACAVPITDRDRLTKAGALLKLRYPVGERELIDFFSQAGPPHAVPKIIQFSASLPQVGPGKVNRAAAAAIVQAAYDDRQVS